MEKISNIGRNFLQEKLKKIRERERERERRKERGYNMMRRVASLEITISNNIKNDAKIFLGG